MQSSKSNHYGTEAEEQVADQLDLDLDRTPWKDGTDQNGTPYEIKAAVHRRSSGRPGRFRIFRKPHRKLVQQQGRYAFVTYRVRGRGIEVLDRRVIAAADLSPEWSPSNHSSPNRDYQTKLGIEEVFG